MNNTHRIKYFLVSVTVVIAALIFLRTYTAATQYFPDSGSLGVISAQAKATTPLIATTIEKVPTATIARPAPTVASTSNVISKANVPASYPVELSIPSLNIKAAVQKLIIKKNGALGSPSNFTDVGWYAAGTIPGERGSAVFDGHVDNGLALAGVFKHLTDIAIGDNVYVTNFGGTTLHFIVTDIQSYDYKNAPADMIFNQNNGTFLKLITCGGSWVPGDKTYDRRIVVTAVLSKPE